MQNTTPTKPKEILELEKFYNITLSETNKGELEENQYVIENGKVVELDLRGNHISDIKPLSNLTALTSLNLSGNQISDIKPISNLTTLTELSLWDNQISDITPLSNLTALMELYLSENQISDIKPLSNLTALAWLYLSRNQISDIKPLSNLTALARLSLSENQISDIMPLSNLTALTWLLLSRNQISDIKPLSNLTALISLDLDKNQISDITPLSNLTALMELYLSENQISDIKPLSNLTALTWLYLSRNQISDIKPLSNLTALTRLDLSYNNISDIYSVKTLLSKLTNLKYLDIHSNKCFDGIEGLGLELFDNHLDTIKNYFAKLDEKSVEIKMPVKVMLMGNHNVGKSTFLNSLLDIKDKTDSTHILRIKDYQSNGAQGLPQAIFFDFGGQDYYHGIYKAFMTKGAINVIFWQTDTDNNNTSPDKSKRNKKTQNFNRKYWIAQLKHYDKANKDETKAWLIQTHVEGEAKKSYFEHSDIDGVSVDELHISMKNRDNKHLAYAKECVKEDIAKSQKTRKEPEWYVGFLMYIRKYKDAGHINIKTLKPHYKREEKNMHFLSNDLEQLSMQGLVLYYNTEALKDVVWLNPEQTALQIHTEILSIDSIKKYKGKAPKDKFEDICDEITRNMLIQNKVIFLDESEQKYIIPGYLPKFDSKNSEFFYFAQFGAPNLALKFKHFIPFGFINQLVCLYGQTPEKKLYWRDVVLFTTDKTKTTILIKLDFQTLSIGVYIKTSSERLQEIQRNILDDILALYNDDDNHQSKFLLSQDADSFSFGFGGNFFNANFYDSKQNNQLLPQDLHISLNSELFVNYARLCDENKTKTEIPAYRLEGEQKILDEKNPITISPRQFKHMTDNKEIQKNKKIFVSYSRKDAEYRDELRKHLQMLKTFSIADNWACEDMEIGKWHEQIQKELEDSDLIIYMLSANFFTSDYILDNEVIRGMELVAHDEKKKILPVIVSEFVGLDKLRTAIAHPNDKQKEKVILGLGAYQFLAYGNDINTITHQKEEKILSLKEFSRRNEIEKALTQIVEKIIEIFK